MSQNTDQPNICTNPRCFEGTCRGECMSTDLWSEVVLDEHGNKTREHTIEHTLDEDGEFTQYIQASDLRQKLVNEMTIGAS